MSRPLQEPPAPRGGRKKKVRASQAKTRKAFARAFTGNQAPLGCVRSCLSHNQQSHGEKNHSPSSTATDSEQQLSAPLAPRPALVRALRSVVPPLQMKHSTGVGPLGCPLCPLGCETFCFAKGRGALLARKGAGRGPPWVRLAAFSLAEAEVMARRRRAGSPSSLRNEGSSNS